MLVTLVSGLGLHRWSPKDVFVFRPWSLPQCAWFDAHNLTGILALLFHLMITFTGLMIFGSIYMPKEVQFLYGGDFILSLLSDLHFAQFGGTALRWLYFLMGLAAAAMIATGLVLWTNKLRKYHAERSGVTRYRVLEALNVATVAGLLVATAVFFWANRVLPVALIDRSQWEMRCFLMFLCHLVLLFCTWPSARGGHLRLEESTVRSCILIGITALAERADDQQSSVDDPVERTVGTGVLRSHCIGCRVVAGLDGPTRRKSCAGHIQS